MSFVRREIDRKRHGNFTFNSTIGRTSDATQTRLRRETSQFSPRQRSTLTKTSRGHSESFSSTSSSSLFSSEQSNSLFVARRWRLELSKRNNGGNNKIIPKKIYKRNSLESSRFFDISSRRGFLFAVDIFNWSTPIDFSNKILPVSLKFNVISLFVLRRRIVFVSPSFLS